MISTLAGAAKILSICRHAVAKALEKKRLNGTKIEGRWVFTYQDLDDYQKSKYDRKYSKIDGEYIYDKSKGEYSISETAKILNCPAQHVYYACHSYKIPATKKRCSWVINEKDIIEYRKVMKIYKQKPRFNN